MTLAYLYFFFQYLSSIIYTVYLNLGCRSPNNPSSPSNLQSLLPLSLIPFSHQQYPIVPPVTTKHNPSIPKLIACPVLYLGASLCTYVNVATKAAKFAIQICNPEAVART